MRQLQPYIFFLFATATFAQTTSQNFVISRTYKQTGAAVNDVGKVNIQVQYLDGIGRPSQTVSVGQSTLGTDLVQPIEYDSYGRQSKAYLPYAAGGLGAFHSTAITNQASFYTSNIAQIESSDLAKPYSETHLESSPLGRDLGQTAQGNNSLSSSISYGSNVLNEVKRYDYSSGTVTANGNYSSNRLYKTKITDENGKTIIEYKDISGLVICKRTVLGGTDSDGANLSTYYVYDDLNQLRAVLQPQYQQEAILSKFAFLYDYDTQGRIISKSIPGAGTTKMVYDTFDRLVLSQDANQYAMGIWSFIKYDIMSRPIMTGVVVEANNHAALQAAFNSSTGHHEDKQNNQVGYTLNNTLPLIDENSVLKATYYDDYNFPKPANLGYNSTYSASAITSAKTRQTGSGVRMMNEGGHWMTSVIYYDSEYRTIQTIRELDDLGSGPIERISTKYKYDLAQVVELEKTEHLLGGTITNVHLKTFEYDHADRLLSIRESLTLNGSPQGTVIKEATTLAQRYNILGQLQQKWFHSDDAVNFRRRTDYTNNIRGWITQGKTVYKQTAGGADLAFYTFGLTYANGGNYTNGNINQMQWAWKDEASFTKGLSFSYDGANRLSGSTGLSGYTDTESGITYDKNGNIKMLIRSGTVEDNLTYSYSGNRMTSITDGSGNNSGIKNGTSNYKYDENGNMTMDENRGVEIISNILNLPEFMYVGGKTLTYSYDGAGTKHKYVADTLTVKYAGSFEYNAANNFSRLALSDGQATYRKDTLRFDYYIKDHLGNVRMVFDEKGNILQRTDYLPFGLEIDRNSPVTSPAARNSVNRYTFLGRESQPETGYMDLKRRFYDPATGGFTSVDPVTDSQEDYSTYQYGWNNPILRSDPNGDCPRCPGGKYLKALTNPITTKSLKYATENQQKIASIKLGGGFGENYGANVFGQEIKFGAFIGYNEITVGSGGVDYNANGFKGTATANLGPINAGGEINILNLNINFGANDGNVEAINGNFVVSGEHQGKKSNISQAGSMMSNGEATLSISAGPATIGLSGSIEALRNTISGYVQAAAGFMQSIVTDITNNTFNTDTAGRNTEQYIREEREPKR